MEVDADKQPSEGEVLVYTTGGGFVVKGSVREIADQLSGQDWTELELAESGDRVIVRGSQVIALRPGSKSRRGSIGFVHRE